jgi:hypothetical protein
MNKALDIEPRSVSVMRGLSKQHFAMHARWPASCCETIAPEAAS